MVLGMATKKITITLPEAQIAEIRGRVAARESASVSGYIQHAVQRTLQNAAEFRVLLDEALQQTGGPVTSKERASARKALAPQKRRARLAKPRRAA
jgi:Arc/MetJ-type ribon-helix-helix transcriptional regulator